MTDTASPIRRIYDGYGGLYAPSLIEEAARLLTSLASGVSCDRRKVAALLGLDVDRLARTVWGRHTLGMARFRRSPITVDPLSSAEFAALSADKRAELFIAARAARHQTILTGVQVVTSLGVIAGLIFTGIGLSQTSIALDSTREEVKIARENLNIANKGQVNERFTRAIAQLGDSSLDVRIGGIYAIEKVAEDAPDYNQTIIDVLAAFIREHDPKVGVDMPEKPAADLQAALTVIGRNRPADAQHEWLDLSFTRLRGADLRNSDLRGANFDAAELDHADFWRADLSGASVFNADLRKASLTAVKAIGVNMGETDLTGALLSGADFSKTNLSSAPLRGAWLQGTDLSEALGLPPSDELKKITKWDDKTTFP
ncbi:pentapeptide repeat-containing protein [Nonomuraea sp. NPDC050153]|uniref:pentapeptide repeat-containing protein n=1 Tax=Nonomuraea sp. NPDC050153 TaxID=3364359 RepID=UPI0037A53C63